MIKDNVYDILIIGGGISGSVFVSNYIKNNPNAKIALIEAGRKLGGRSSTRFSNRFKGWRLNHGSPNLNICNKDNNILIRNFIEQLLKKNLIKLDDSDLTNLSEESNSNSLNNLDFSSGVCYSSTSSMSDLSKNIISINNLRNQIDFFFQTFIVDLKFNNNEWGITSQNGTKFKSKFLVCSSNLLLHKRSMQILNKDKIPLREAIPKNNEKRFDQLFNILDQQYFIPRYTFLIYTLTNYKYKDNYLKKYRYFQLSKDLEMKYKIERVIFQLQENKKLGIVVHTKNFNFIKEYIKQKDENLIKQELIKSFNDLFEGNNCINQLTGKEEISIMRWRASQPFGMKVPLSFQLFRNYKIGFCGDWFEGEGFGRIEGSILSALILAEQFNY